MEKPDLVDRVCDLLAYRFDQYVDRWQVIASLVIAVCIMALSLGLYIRGRVSLTPKVIQAAPSAANAPQADKKDGSFLYVYVCGAVNKPGVYRVGNGTRINAAVALAGGLAADADAAPVNLAKKLTDGERIYIPRVNERAAANSAANSPSTASGSGGAPGDPGNSGNINGVDPGLNGGQLTSAWNSDGKLNLNAATAEDLDKLPGIGPAFIARIMEYRQKHNGFTDIAQLRNIDGIGPKTYAKLKPLVCIE